MHRVSRTGAPQGPARDRAAADIPCALILGLLVVLPMAAWMQHVHSCILSGSWGFLIGGTLFLRAGLVHGVGRWLEFWGGGPAPSN